MKRRSSLVLLVLAGLLLLLHPVLRPYSSEVGSAGAEAFASPLWVMAHTAGMLGLLALALAVRELAAGRMAETMAVAGVAMVLPYYGAETFALEVLGRASLEDGNTSLLALADPIRFGPVQTAMFTIGLVLIAASGVTVARRLRGCQAWLFGGSLVLLGPQFFAPPWLRITHGVLVLAGCVALAMRERSHHAKSLPGASVER